MQTYELLKILFRDARGEMVQLWGEGCGDKREWNL
jgi:hypothetical protein